METDWNEYEEKAIRSTESASSSPELEDVRVLYLGRKSRSR